MSEDQEHVNIELHFKDGTETVEIPKNMFLQLQMEALQDDMSFECKFIQVIKHEMEQDEN